MFFKKYTALLLCCAVCLSVALTGCESNKPSDEVTTTLSQTEATTAEQTTVPESYDDKKAVSALYFAERAVVNGFGVNNQLQEGDAFVSYYTANFGASDVCEFIETETEQDALDMYSVLYEGMKMNADSITVIDSTDVDKSNFKKYTKTLENAEGQQTYVALVCVGKTVLSVRSSITEKPRYEIFLKDINY